MDQVISYRIRPRVSDADLNALFGASWPEQNRMDFPAVLLGAVSLVVLTARRW